MKQYIALLFAAMLMFGVACMQPSVFISSPPDAAPPQEHEITLPITETRRTDTEEPLPPSPSPKPTIEPLPPTPQPPPATPTPPKQPAPSPTPAPTPPLQPSPAPQPKRPSLPPLKPQPGFRVGAADTFGVVAPEIQHTRMVIFWSLAEPEQGVWDELYLQEQENYLFQERLQGRYVNVVLVGAPPWASNDGVQDGVPTGLDLALENPQNFWARFVRNMVQRYGSMATHWTAQNEPDIQPPSCPHGKWRGTMEEMFAVHKTAYKTIKAVNRELKVHLPGFMHWCNYNYFAQFLDIILKDPEAKTHEYFFDYASLNLQGAVQVYREVPLMWRDILRARRIEKPIWITEANLIPAPWFAISDEEQASWLIQAAALAAVGGIERFTVFRWGTDPPPDLNGKFDIITKPAARALLAAGAFFNGTTEAKLARSGWIWQVELLRNDQKIIVAWNMTANDAVFRFTPGNKRTARAYDKYGKLLAELPAGKEFSFPLPHATAYFYSDDGSRDVWVGGEPLIVIEEPERNE